MGPNGPGGMGMGGPIMGGGGQGMGMPPLPGMGPTGIGPGGVEYMAKEIVTLKSSVLYPPPPGMSEISCFKSFNTM